MLKNLPVTENECDYEAGVCMETVTDPFGRIVEVNEHMVRISGYSREELLGSCHNIVRHPDMPEVAFADLWNTLQSGEEWQGIVKNRCKNGDYFWICETITPIYRDGIVVGYHSRQVKPSPRQIAMAGGLYQHLRH